MKNEDFKKYVLAEAQKYLFSKESEVPADVLKLIKENVVITTTSIKPAITPSEVKKLAEEMKKINKVVDLRNPLIAESDESLVESILNENKTKIRERELDVDDINKKKHITYQNEGEKTKWERMLNYNIPNDEERS